MQHNYQPITAFIRMPVPVQKKLDKLKLGSKEARWQVVERLRVENHELRKLVKKLSHANSSLNLGKRQKALQKKPKQNAKMHDGLKEQAIMPAFLLKERRKKK